MRLQIKSNLTRRAKIRCSCCNKALTDYESCLRHAETLDFLDTCLQCLKETAIPTMGRSDLNPYERIEDDVFDNHEDSEWDEESYD